MAPPTGHLHAAEVNRTYYVLAYVPDTALLELSFVATDRASVPPSGGYKRGYASQSSYYSSLCEHLAVDARAAWRRRGCAG